MGVWLFRMLFSAFCALFIILALPNAGYSQTYEIVGMLISQDRGEGVPGVEIQNPEGAKLGVSQSTGRFEVTVNNRRAHLIFRKPGYRDLDLDLADVPQLIDIEVTLESVVRELEEVVAYAPRSGKDPSQAHSMEELELMQGMRMDLNDHLRQMHGVSGMNEFTNDISVYGSRTQDVTHYLGASRIPSLRHLEFGFPGNLSVLNPRLLQSITLADNPAKGPLNQGNSSALVYDLREGDPEAIHGDLILGSVNRELNLTGYWGQRTYLTSFRLLDPKSLGTLGSKYFTNPKDARLRRGGTACKGCPPPLAEPFQFTLGDIFLGTFRRDSTGSMSRYSLLILSDEYQVLEDMSTSIQKNDPQILVKGNQGAWLYTYESLSPSTSGDWEWGGSLLTRNTEDSYHDTLPVLKDVVDPIRPWYRASSGAVDYLIGDGARRERQSILSSQWSPSQKKMGAQTSMGLEWEYRYQERDYKDLSIPIPMTPNIQNLRSDLVLANVQYRMRWNLSRRRGVEASLGLASGHTNLTLHEDGKWLMPMPLGSLRYLHPITEQHKVFADIAIREAAAFEPSGYNEIKVKNTPSAEMKIGGDGMLGRPLQYAWSLYNRGYFEPALPSPEVYWNYAETRSAEYAYVGGASTTLTYLPNHHIGIGVNASWTQGDYYLTGGESLPWESNRSLDLVANMRLLPRSDSLISFIFTYGAQNDAPLYAYRGLWDPTLSKSTGQRTLYQNKNIPQVSRQRLDMRINLDLKSKWRPLESMRFFFEADNMFADFDDTWASWLGGSNQRRRGWTRANASGDLEPMVTRGLGLFIMFGIEGKLKI